MSEDRLHDARARAARAHALVNDELLVEGFERLEAAYIGAWRSTMPSDEKAREKLYIAVNAIGKIREHLKIVIANGKIADAELKTLIETEERKKRFGVF